MKLNEHNGLALTLLTGLIAFTVGIVGCGETQLSPTETNETQFSVIKDTGNVYQAQLTKGNSSQTLLVEHRSTFDPSTTETLIEYTDNGTSRFNATVATGPDALSISGTLDGQAFASGYQAVNGEVEVELSNVAGAVGPLRIVDGTELTAAEEADWNTFVASTDADANIQQVASAILDFAANSGFDDEDEILVALALSGVTGVNTPPEGSVSTSSSGTGAVAVMLSCMENACEDNGGTWISAGWMSQCDFSDMSFGEFFAWYLDNWACQAEFARKLKPFKR